MSQRFSDAELAAEYWRIYSEHVRDSSQVLYEKGALDNRYITAGFRTNMERAQILYRFATLPHAHDPEPRTVYVYDVDGRCVGSFAEPWPREEPFRNWSINTGKDC